MSEERSPADSRDLDITRTYPRHESRPPAIADEPPAVPEPAGRKLGNFTLIRKLGEGGMGVVYEAEQDQPRRRVALKVVRGGAHISELQVRLFHHEAQMLARLRHRSIAGIYEIGTTEDGQHFFAMELVRGEPLTDYVRSRAGGEAVPQSRDEIRWRLGSFLEICDAISYAHQRGVIHRDLKPSNVLVAGGDNQHWSGSDSSLRATVKILDFGLARMTDPDESLATLVTQIGQIKGTLAYMSPEQARGDDVDIRTDIYSLGVILYELLTGDLPYEFARPVLSEAVRVICESAPRRPGAALKLLRGDLETIVLKALEKEPERRYQSADALAEDLERLLTNQPILARPPSAAYQLAKLIARYKLPFAFGVILAVLVVASTITMGVLYRDQRIARLELEDNNRRLAAAIESMTTEINQPPVTAEPLFSPLPLPLAAEEPPAKEPERPAPRQPESRAVVEKPTVSQAAAVRRNTEPERRADDPPAARPVPPAPEPQLLPTESAADPPRESVRGQDLYTAGANLGAAELHISFGRYQQAEGLLLESHRLVMSTNELETKLDTTRRLVRLYRLWGRLAKVTEYELLMAKLEQEPLIPFPRP